MSNAEPYTLYIVDHEFPLPQDSSILFRISLFHFLYLAITTFPYSNLF